MTEQLLIVDDDEFICDINQEILSRAGYNVRTAGDGLAAWEILESNPSQFDLIILDKHMPRLDGMGLLARLKSVDEGKEVPVIMLTGDNQEQDVAEGLKAGAYYYLTKPSEEAVLLQVVRNALNDLYAKLNLRSLIGQHTPGLKTIKRAEFTLRTIEEAQSLAIVLADATSDPAKTVNGYSELLINAIEHGNLGITYEEKSLYLKEGCLREEIQRRLMLPPYSERQVSVLLANYSNVNTVTICDEGEGFDWRGYLEFRPERAFDLHGRGIAMSKALSFDDVRYVGEGNTVIATFVKRTKR